MSDHLLIAFVAFAVAALFTPGPNNVMLMTSALNFGPRRTIPHMLGVNFGFAILVIVIGLGLGLVIQAVPAIYTVLKFAGAAYLVWLAIGIARSGPVGTGGPTHGHPMTFFGAALFQWVNAKAWVVAVGAVSAYAGVAPFPYNAAVLASLLFAVGLMSSGSWILFGSALKYVLTSPRAIKIFNVGMAFALVASLVPVFWDK